MSFFRRAGAAIARFFKSAADPAAEPNKILMYSKDAGGAAQLFARSDNGTVYQITPAGAAAGSQGPPVAAVFGSFSMVSSGQYFDDLVTDALITKSKDAGGVTSIQHVDRRHAVGCERMLVQAADARWATFVFGQVNGPSVGGGFSLYQFADSPITRGVFEWRVAGEEGAPQALDDWTTLIGMAQTDQPTITNAQVAGFYFHSNFARYGNGNWWAVMSDGGGGFVQADTGIALDFSWHRFTITYDSTAQQLTFYIDGIQRAQLSTAVVIPTAYSPMLSVGNTGVGVSDQRDYYADYFYGYAELTRGTAF